MKTDEVSKFYRWIYNEVQNNDMATLGPFRLAKEHVSQKKLIVPPDQWLPKMAVLMSQKTGASVSLVEVASDFNKLIESGEIENWIGRTNKRIAEDTIKELTQGQIDDQSK